MMKKLILAIFISVSVTASAQDRVFTYTYQSNVLNKGVKEIEVWNTVKWQKSNFYRGLDSRMEFEIGLGHNLQTAFYLNANTATAQSGTSLVNQGTELSFSNEWKLKLSDPVANKIGSALYAEIGVSGDEVELETKLLLDKQIGRSTHALNLVHEFEFEKEFENGKFETEAESKVEVDYGFSHKVSNSLNLGFELRQTGRFGTEAYATLFGGPGLSYYGNKFWINFTILPQIYSFKGATDNHLNLAQHEKVETRLIFSFQL